MTIKEITAQLRIYQEILHTKHILTGEILDASSEDLARLKEVTYELHEMAQM